MSESEHHTNYIKIWAILVVLLVVSVAGPMLEIQVVTLLTAFGIAVVKAFMVAKYFMHITMEQKYITYMMVTCLVFMLLFFAGASPDVMKDEGDNWVKPSWQEARAAWVAGGHIPEHHGEPSEE